MMDDVAKTNTESAIEELLVFLQVKTVMNPKKKIANADIGKECQCDLAKEIAPKIRKDAIDYDRKK